MKITITLTLLALMFSSAYTSTSRAVNIEFVPVGNVGNSNDTTGYGGVATNYNIAKYEVTNKQYREFLTAKAGLGDPNGLYSTEMGSNIYGGIAQSGAGTAGDPYVYSAKSDAAAWDNRPVNYVSFWDVARFANWMHNGMGSGSTESGAYSNIGNQSTFARQPGAKWFIPTEDEWYKAAYHKNDGDTGSYYKYPTGSDDVPSNNLTSLDGGNNANFRIVSDFTLGRPYYTTPVGEFENSASPYGTFDQGGNLAEWNETAIGSVRGMRGGNWFDLSGDLAASTRDSRHPTYESGGVGFRVASVPEPGSITLLLCGALGLLMRRGRRR